jgi:hypothetical protein
MSRRAPGSRPAVVGWSGGDGAEAGVLRPAGPRGCPGTARLRAGARDRRGRGGGGAHRGRGVHGSRGPCFACIPGTDAAERGDVRAAGTRLRLLHVRHALLREPGVLAGGHRVRCVAPGWQHNRGGEACPRAPRAEREPDRAPRAGAWSGTALPGPRHRPGARRRGRVRTGLTAAHPARPRRPHVGYRGGSSRGGEQRSRGAMAVLDSEGAERVRVPGVCAAPQDPARRKPVTPPAR